jgi:hypothetical protein
MKTALIILLAGVVLVMSSCASSKPCPAYAWTSDVEVNG